MKISQKQQDLLIGTLLGDGNLQTFTNSGQTWRYRALHKAEHKKYIDHKYDLLKNYCKTAPSFSSVWDERTQKNQGRWFFNTLTTTDFYHIAHLFYKFDQKTKKWKKRVPVTIEKYLTPRAIAYWYMDDGALKWLNHSNAMRICTDSFTLNDVNRLRRILFEKYKISTNVSTYNKISGPIYRIEIPERSAAAFRDLILPYLLDCMKYRVSNGNRGHL